jgi:hypothetical protein
MPAVWLQGMESSFNFVRVSLSNFIWDAKCHTHTNLPIIWVRGPYSLVTESSFYVGRISLSNFIRDGNLTFWCARSIRW